MPRASSFTFASYEVDSAHSRVSFTYRVEFESGKVVTYTDHLLFPDVAPDLWNLVPKAVLEPTLQALLLMIGINYWCVFPTRNIHIEKFSLTREQAEFWNSMYRNGLGEFFYEMKIDFRDLIAFPYDSALVVPTPLQFKRPKRALLLNGAGKDSILSAEILKASNAEYDLFAFAPTPAHKNIAKLIGAKTVRVHRNRDPRIERMTWRYRISGEYPSVSAFTFVAALLCELLGYSEIIFSNEKSADFGNLTYLGLDVNHQWCKSSEAEKMVNDYIQRYLTKDISTRSLLREYSELEIVRRFVQYPQYLHSVTSCNNYFGQTWLMQKLSRTPYWCNECPKCAFLFACFAAYLPKEEVIDIFGENLFAKKRLLPLFKRILGIEGFKPLDCVGEPEEMILAMHYAAQRGEYPDTPTIRMFELHFPPDYDFHALERQALHTS